MRVLGDASDESLLSVMIGRENPVEGLQTTSLVSSGYGSGGETLAKLAQAEAAAMLNPRYVRNVEALRRVQPKDLAPSDITARLGAPSCLTPDRRLADARVALQRECGKSGLGCVEERLTLAQLRVATDDPCCGHAPTVTVP